MKSFNLILLFVLSPLSFFAQQQLSGLWMGALSNDSTTIRKDGSFEIVLAEYKGKVSGYSRSTFTVNDTLYYIVKRVKGTIDGDVCEVKDDEIVSHNFPKRPEKGVKVISTFHRNKSDSIWYLSGDWKTTQTKKYYTVSGKVDLKEEKDLDLSKIFPHLEELGLDKNIPFYTAYKKEKEDAIAKAANKNQPPKTNTADVVTKKPDASSVVKTSPVKTNADEKKNSDVAKVDMPKSSTISTGAVTKPETTIPKVNSTPIVTVPTDPDKKKSAGIAKTEPIVAKTNNPATIPSVATENKNNTVVKSEPEKKTTTPINTISKPDEVSTKTNTNPVTAAPVVTNEKTNTVASIEPKKTTTIVSAPVKPETSTTAPINEKKNTGIDKIEPLKTETVSTTIPYQPVDRKAPAAFIAQRITDKPQELTYVSDSLVLILYDNGEVDGDTVSVLLNGEMFMPNQRLSTAAIRKTIYITPGNENMTLVLYAENLGKYPPNTGLLVIYDGEERYQLRFSADLNKNASVVFRRKK